MLVLIVAAATVGIRAGPSLHELCDALQPAQNGTTTTVQTTHTESVQQPGSLAPTPTAAQTAPGVTDSQQQTTQTTLTNACQQPMALLVPWAVLGLILAPGVGLACNSLGLCLLGPLLDRGSRFLVKGNEVKSPPPDADEPAHEAQSWLRLQQAYTLTWDYWSRVESAGVLTRTMSFLSLVGLVWVQFVLPELQFLWLWLVILAVAFFIASAYTSWYAKSGVLRFGDAVPKAGLFATQTSGANPPATRAHVVGEVVWNSGPAVGQPIGWSWTGEGSPGTWHAMPNLPPAPPPP